jgi:hypothetical protein|tara:strand:+ start:99 stop:785 length:687 start_codon:yes stop_codon:yes gene_type:complete
MPQAKKTTTEIALPPLNIQPITLILVGTSPLIVNNWSKKAIQEMLDKQMGNPKAKKAPKVPFEDFCESLYWMDDDFNEIKSDTWKSVPTEEDVENGRFGFPANGLKAAAVTACTSVANVTKVAARQAFYIPGQLVEIQSPVPPSMRQDMVRVGMGTADIRFRAEFWPWSITATIKHNANVISAGEVANLFNTAGFGVGLGEWRMEKDGNNGLFEVGTTEQVALLEAAE